MGDQALGLKLGATPGKLLLVAALALILIWLVVSQQPASTTVVPPPPRKAVAAASRPAPALQPSKQHAISPAAAAPPRRPADLSHRWTLDVALQHDPFAVPPPLQPTVATASTSSAGEQETDEPAAAAEETLAVQQRKLVAREQAMTALAERRVSMVFRKGREWIAVIGDEVYQAGDQIDSFRIVEIGPEGVTIEDNRIY